MADEANDSNPPNRRTNMDLNLYLGLPRSPRRARPDLGSDLALSSIPINSSSSTSSVEDDSSTPANNTMHIETAESQPPAMPMAIDQIDDNGGSIPSRSSPQYTPYYPSYESSSYPPLLHNPTNPLLPAHLHHFDDQPATPFSADNHLPYSPPSPYVAPPSQPYLPHPHPHSNNAQENEEDDIPFSFYPQPYLPPPPRYMTATHAELLRPEIRFRRLIETNHRLQPRRFRSSFSHGSSGMASASASTAGAGAGVTAAELQTGQETVACNDRTRTTEANARNGSMEEEEASDEDSKENVQKSAANFECNICFEMAREPVVTSCGHLFCWPCLYQWLHVHSDHRECPVCKGEVTDTNITPIYGRGGSSSDSNGEKSTALIGVGEDGVKIPPRPRGNRVESFRQQFRPISRRFGEGFASMRRLWDPQIRAGGSGSHRLDPNVDAAMHEMIDGVQRRALTRLRARRLQREELLLNVVGNNSEVMAHGMVDRDRDRDRDTDTDRDTPAANANANSGSVLREGIGIDLWQRFSLYGLANTERLAAITADLGRVVGQFASISGSGTTTTTNNNNGPLEPSSSERAAADQVSASSTMAVIQGGDAGASATGNSEGPASASASASASSRAQRRHVHVPTAANGNGASTSTGAANANANANTGEGEGSLDVDGAPSHHLRKRRRLN